MSKPPYPWLIWSLMAGHAPWAFAQSTSVEAPTVVVRGAAVAAPEADGKPADTLAGEDLRRHAAGTLGETVAHMPGTHNASFGPGVGLPVIRGFSGSRVRIAIDGMGTHDASSLSPDHAVAFEPLLAEEIRVVRGPETVRHGSSAIGGAVELSDGRILTKRLRRPVEAAAEARAGSNGHERAEALKLRGSTGPLILHVDGFHRERGNLGIPGNAIDAEAIQRQFGLPATGNTREYVPNTDIRNHGGGIGLSYVGERLHLGASVGSLESNYGIPPGGHSHAGTVLLDPTAIEGQNIRIDMQQTRFDVKGELFLPHAALRSVRLRAARVQYRHDEVDGSRVITTFSNRVSEYRLEGDHGRDRLRGTVGMHLVDRDFSALGEEAFVPRSLVNVRAGYLIEKYDTPWFTVEGAWRTEDQEILPDPIVRTGRQFVFPATSFQPTTWSAALSVKFGPRSRLTGTLSRPERAPDVQELYSLGPHLATRTYAIGNRNLRLESMQRTDLGFAHEWSGGVIQLNAFRYEARDFIYQRARGLFYDLDGRRINALCVSLERCLPVYQYDQQNANFNGYEAQITLRTPDTRIGALEWTLFTDAVRGRFTTPGAGDVPRLPPRRTGFEIAHFTESGWATRLRWTHAAAQANPGNGETESPGYNLVNLSTDRTFDTVGRVEWTVFAHARNLLNEDIRNAVSFLRSFAPEAGRRVELGIRAKF